jgi:hypothetical protein
MTEPMKSPAATKPTSSPTSSKVSGKPTPQPMREGDIHANEGEGNVTAARHYDDATREYIKSGRSDAAAKAAEKAIDGPEGDELRKAEEVGKSHRADVNRKP